MSVVYCIFVKSHLIQDLIPSAGIDITNKVKYRFNAEL